MAWLKVSSAARLGTRFIKIRSLSFGGPYGQSIRPAKWYCQVCGRSGFGTEDQPYEWADACRRGHAPCDWCGRWLALKIDGQPRLHPARDVPLIVVWRR